MTALVYFSPDIPPKYAAYGMMSFAAMFAVSGFFVLKDLVKNRNKPSLENLNIENALAVKMQLKEQKIQLSKDKLRRIASGFPD